MIRKSSHRFRNPKDPIVVFVEANEARPEDAAFPSASATVTHDARASPEVVVD